MRVDADSAYVLHSRPWRESSLLVDLFTRQHGRVRGVARSARSRKGGNRFAPFVPLIVGWSGRGDLKTLHQAEPDGTVRPLWGQQLFVGLYINELLLRLLPEHDPHEPLYDRYLMLLRNLADTHTPEPMLRAFELSLLEELGYGLVLDTDAVSAEAVESCADYLFHSEVGVTRHFDSRAVDPKCVFSGAHLLSIAADDYHLPDVCHSAKRLVRLALQPHLGNQPLRSRELFVRSPSGTSPDSGKTT